MEGPRWKTLESGSSYPTFPHRLPEYVRKTSFITKAHINGFRPTGTIADLHDAARFTHTTLIWQKYKYLPDIPDLHIPPRYSRFLRTSMTSQIGT